MEREGDALAQRRVAVEPELDEGARAGIGQVDLARGPRRAMIL